MNCSDLTDELLTAYLDAELGLAQSVEVAQHLENCPACLARYQEILALSASLKDNQFYFSANRAFQIQVAERLRQVHRKPFYKRIIPLNMLAVAASLLLAICTIGLLWIQKQELKSSMNRELLTAQIRWLEPEHLIKAMARDQNSMKPMYSDKLEYPLRISDFSAQGFELVGGRLDYIADRPVFVMVYKHENYLVNIFTWPKNSDQQIFTQLKEVEGYNFISWEKGRARCCAISQLDTHKMESLAELLKSS